MSEHSRVDVESLHSASISLIIPNSVMILEVVKGHHSQHLESVILHVIDSQSGLKTFEASEMLLNKRFSLYRFCSIDPHQEVEE